MYEEDIITKEELFQRKEELNIKINQLTEEKQPLIVAVSGESKEEIPYELIQDILKNFSKLLSSCESREEQKTLLHMIISEITINEQREIDSIKLKINDNLVEYISSKDVVSIADAPSIFVLRRVGLARIDFNIAI